MDKESSFLRKLWAIILDEVEEYVIEDLNIHRLEGTNGQKGNVFSMPSERPYSFTSLDPQE